MPFKTHNRTVKLYEAVSLSWISAILHHPPNFDKSKVKGLVASLIHLNPDDYNKSTALEITAGGKLYNVVVQDERVGQDLLQNGKLKKRVTIIPLNKIHAFRMAAQVRLFGGYSSHRLLWTISIESPNRHKDIKWQSTARAKPCGL